MADDEPELDAEGRPRRDDPRDFAEPIPTGKRNWLPLMIVAVLVVLTMVIAIGP